MKILSDENLLHAYRDAIDLALDPNFIQLLLLEIHRRNLNTNLPTLHSFMPAEHAGRD